MHPNESTDAASGLCLGYIMGIADLTQLLQQKNVLMVAEDGGDATAVLTWCRPRGVINRQLVDLVVRELRAHPENRHIAAMAAVMNALRTSYPCQP